jgi:hypothetical protein
VIEPIGLRRLVLALAAGWAVVIAVVFALRIGFPLELEWMEGGALHQALRLQRGEPVYGPPSSAFVPHLYMPLYPALLAVLGTVLPLDYALARAVSIVAVVATCAALWQAVAQTGKPLAHRAVAPALFLSGYVFTFRWLDLARIDATFMAFTAWGLVVLRGARGRPRRLVAAGVLLSLAFWTKQTAFVPIVVAGPLALWLEGRRVWILVVTVAVVCGGGLVIGHAVTDGWLWTYVYELHQQHAFNAERFWLKTWGMFAHAAPFLVALLGWLGVRALRPPRSAPAAHSAYWGAAAASAAIASALGYATQWAEPNAFVPGVALGAVFVAIVLPVGGRAETIALGLCAAQLAFAAIVEPRYQPIQDRGPSGIAASYRLQDLARTLPGAERTARAADLRQDLAHGEGPMLALQRPWWNTISGGDGHVASMGLHDVPEADAEAVRDAIRSEVRSGRFARVWFEGEVPAWLRIALRDDFVVRRRRIGEERVLPLSGFMSAAGMSRPWPEDQLELGPPVERPAGDGALVLGDFEDGAPGWELAGFRPVASLPGREGPALGPLGGRRLLSTLDRDGRARSPAFTVAPAGRLRLLLGASGEREGLRVEVVHEDGRAVAVAIPGPDHRLEPVELAVPPDWRGGMARLMLVDDAPDGALHVDDVWVESVP